MTLQLIDEQIAALLQKEEQTAETLRQIREKRSALEISRDYLASVLPLPVPIPSTPPPVETTPTPTTDTTPPAIVCRPYVYDLYLSVLRKHEPDFKQGITTLQLKTWISDELPAGKTDNYIQSIGAEMRAAGLTIKGDSRGIWVPHE